MNTDFILLGILFVGLVALNKEYITSELFFRKDEDKRNV
jgi:hypothetical protein